MTQLPPPPPPGDPAGGPPFGTTGDSVSAPPAFAPAPVGTNPFDQRPYLQAPAYPVAPWRPRVWTVFVAFVVAAVGGMLASVVVAMAVIVVRHGVEAIRPGAADQFETLFLDPWVFLPSVAATQVVLIGVALAGAALSPLPWRKRLRLGRPQLPWYGHLIVVVGTLALAVVSSKLIELTGYDNQGALKMFSDALAGLRGPALVLAALVIGVSPGLGEEFLFRGYIQTRLTARWGRFVSIGTTALLFALIHLDLVQGAFVLLLGIYLGEVSERAGSIWPCVLCHAVSNTISTLLVPLDHQTAGAEPSLTTSLAVLGVGGVVLAACVAYVLRRPLPPREAAPAHPAFAGGAPIQWPPGTV